MRYAETAYPASPASAPGSACRQSTTKGKSMNRDQKRKQIWNDFVATYQRVMIETPEKFEQFCADMRAKYLAA